MILKFCGGGGNGLAAATSSGPELLIEFVTSPFGTFAASPVQSRTLNGFQLEVRFVHYFLLHIVGKIHENEKTYIVCTKMILFDELYDSSKIVQ